jgi:hypothetical protein
LLSACPSILNAKPTMLTYQDVTPAIKVIKLLMSVVLSQNLPLPILSPSLIAKYPPLMEQPVCNVIKATTLICLLNNV